MPHTEEMTDDRNIPDEKKPSDARRLSRRPHRMQSASPSRESRFIGYLVLGFGVLALIAVLLIAFNSSGVEEGDLPDARTASELQQTIEQTGQAVERPARQSAPELMLKRAKSVDESDIQGGWQAQIGEYVAVLQIQRGAFQIILASPQPGTNRLYSSGTYRIIDDIVALEPRLDWKAPAAQSGVIYERLTTGSYPMIVGFQNGAMVWQNVPQGEKRIYVPPRSPLLLDPAKNYIVWRRVD